MNSPIYAVAALYRENKKLKSRLTSYMADAETWRAQWVAEHKSNEMLERENAKLKRRLEILKDHGIEIADAVAGGFEIYNKEHARADRLKVENTKLKELALEIWRSCPVSEDDCKKCPHYIEESDEVSCDIPILMEKLGVEVNA